MKTILAFCCAVAVFQANVEAQSWMPQNLIPLPSVLPSFGGFTQILSAVTSIHSALSKTPLKQFLPGPLQMAQNIYQVTKAAKDAQDAMNKARDQLTSMITQAAQQAKLPLPQLNQLTSQMQSALSGAIGQVGSAPPPSTSSRRR